MPQRAGGGGNLPSAASSCSVDGGDTGFRRCRHPGASLFSDVDGRSCRPSGDVGL